MASAISSSSSGGGASSSRQHGGSAGSSVEIASSLDGASSAAADILIEDFVALMVPPEPYQLLLTKLKGGSVFSAAALLECTPEDWVAMGIAGVAARTMTTKAREVLKRRAGSL
jgi:hypothetical protein